MQLGEERERHTHTHTVGVCSSHSHQNSRLICTNLTSASCHLVSTFTGGDFHPPPHHLDHRYHTISRSSGNRDSSLLTHTSPSWPSAPTGHGEGSPCTPPHRTAVGHSVPFASHSSTSDMVNLMTSDSPFMVARILADLYAFNQEPVSKCVSSSEESKCVKSTTSVIGESGLTLSSFNRHQEQEASVGRSRAANDASYIGATPPCASVASRSCVSSGSCSVKRQQRSVQSPSSPSSSSSSCASSSPSAHLLICSDEDTSVHRQRNEVASAKSHSMKRKKVSDENTGESKVAEAASLDAQGASRDAVVSAAKRSSERQKERLLKHRETTTPSKRNTCGPPCVDHNNSTANTTTQVHPVKTGRTSRHACSFPGCHKVYGEYGTVILTAHIHSLTSPSPQVKVLT